MPQHSEVRCGTCPAYHRQPGRPGECRGTVPNMYVTAAPTGPLGPQVAIHPVFPPMPETSYCAKHPKFDWTVSPLAEAPTAGAA